MALHSQRAAPEEGTAGPVPADDDTSSSASAGASSLADEPEAEQSPLAAADPPTAAVAYPYSARTGEHPYSCGDPSASHECYDDDVTSADYDDDSASRSRSVDFSKAAAVADEHLPRPTRGRSEGKNVKGMEEKENSSGTTLGEDIGSITAPVTDGHVQQQTRVGTDGRGTGRHTQTHHGRADI